jgi:hypothetical protein
MVVNLADNYYPYVEYPENTIRRNSDARAAAHIARDLWETRKRIRGEDDYPIRWETRHMDDIQNDIKVVLDLMDRGVIR